MRSMLALLVVSLAACGAQPANGFADGTEEVFVVPVEPDAGMPATEAYMSFCDGRLVWGFGDCPDAGHKN